MNNALVSTDQNRFVIEQIEKSRNNVSKKLNELINIKNESYIDLVYYIIIVGIMCFFVYIVLNDMYKTLKFYQLQNQDIQSARKPAYLNERDLNRDENEFTPKNESNPNFNLSVQSSLENSQQELERNFDQLLKFKKEHDIDDSLKTSISTKVINHINDDYIYDTSLPSKSSFWNSLFKKSKYPSVVNNADGSYLELI